MGTHSQDPGGTLKVAVIHSFYSSGQPSGENSVVRDQVAALERAGHNVILWERETDREAQRWDYPVRTLIRVASGRGVSPRDALSDFRPDVVHVHNLFPNISNGWLLEHRWPTVVSLHNYRAVCSNGTLFRDGGICTDCVTGGSFHAVVHGCYRGSPLATAPVALSRRRDRRILHQAADAIITTSQGSDRILRTFLGADLRTHVIPNFTPDVSPAQNPSASNSRWLAMGRFSPEKGFAELIQSWPEGPALDVIGDGPLRSQLMDMARARRVSIKPVLPLDELREVLSAYVGLVFPSTWFDVAPQVVSEAMRVGLPVVALATNTVADVVNATGSGATYLTDAELARAIRQVESNRPDMSRAARACYESNWTERAWLSAVDSLYADVAQLPLG